MALVDSVLSLPSPVSLDPGEWRRIASLLVPASGGSSNANGFSGVRAYGTDPVSTAGSILNVSELVGALSSSLAGATGVYQWRTPARTHTIPTADTSQSRTDSLYVRVWDDSVDQSGLNGVDTVYAVGTPGGGAPLPPVDTISLWLATISVPANGSGSVQWIAPQLPLPVLLARNATELPDTNVPEGQYADVAFDKTTVRYSNGVWEEIARVPSVYVSGATAATDWSISGLSAKKMVGPFVSGYLAVNRTGADLSPDAGGNIAPDNTVATLPVPLRPRDDEYTSCGNGSGSGEAAINTVGEVRIRSWTPGNSISSSDAALRINLDFMAAS